MRIEPAVSTSIALRLSELLNVFGAKCTFSFLFSTTPPLNSSSAFIRVCVDTNRAIVGLFSHGFFSRSSRL